MALLVRSWGPPADVGGMLFLLTLLTAGYFTAVAMVWRGSRRAGGAAAARHVLAALPAEDQPPPSAVGWPPAGDGFTPYVEEGIAALDAYRSQGHAA